MEAEMNQPLDQAALDQLFDKARTNNKWQPREVPDTLLKQIVEHMRWGPTSANCSPARIVFVKSAAAKARLKPHLSAGNVEKTMAAPATAIIGYDLNFYEYLPRLYPPADAKSWFVGKKAHADTTAFRNGSLQGGYFILAARALGLDCGPMSGFDNAAVDAEFFAGTEIRSNFLCNLGFGDPEGVYPRSPRFSFDEMATIV
jgi:3-hydroxypropanoate dehydrogenase